MSIRERLWAFRSHWSCTQHSIPQIFVSLTFEQVRRSGSNTTCDILKQQVSTTVAAPGREYDPFWNILPVDFPDHPR